MNRFIELMEEINAFKKKRPNDKLEVSKVLGASLSNKSRKSKTKTFHLTFTIVDEYSQFVDQGTVDYVIVKDGQTISNGFIYNDRRRGDIGIESVKLIDNRDIGRIKVLYEPGLQSMLEPYFQGAGHFYIEEGSSSIAFNVKIRYDIFEVTANSQEEAFRKTIDNYTKKGNGGLNIKILSIGGSITSSEGSEAGNRQVTGESTKYKIRVPLSSLEVTQIKRSS